MNQKQRYRFFKYFGCSSLLFCRFATFNQFVNMEKIEIIGFDADDTLWVNEPFFRETERKFEQVMSDYADSESVSKALFSTEMKNLVMYGYGAKGFTLSMIETALEISQHRIPPSAIREILHLGQCLLDMPIELLDGVKEVLKTLSGSRRYRLVVATKGDLTDQQRKLKKSGLENYFDHIEIMSNKTEKDYSLLLKHLEAEAASFLMVGNSLKSDILPVLSLGGSGIHVPAKVTWQHEKAEIAGDHPRFRAVASISEVIEILA